MSEFNEGHIVEGCDRCHVLMGNINDYLEGHPAVVAAQVEDKIQTAMDALMGAYQAIGSLDDKGNLPK